MRRSLSLILGLLMPGLGLAYLSRLRLAALFFGLWLVALGLPVLAGFFGVVPAIMAMPVTYVVIVASLVVTWRVFPPAGRVAKRELVVLGSGLALVAGGVGATAVAAPLLPVEAISHPAESMRPTFEVGDYSWVWKATRLKPLAPLRRGDMIVFWDDGFAGDDGLCRAPSGLPAASPVYWVKRVVGLPGDVVALDGNRLSINGRLVSVGQPGTADITDQYGVQARVAVIRERLPGAAGDISVWNYGSDGPYASFGPLTVPSGTVFVLGDNRDNSVDSRACGPVAISRVVGVVTHRYRNNGRWGIKPVETGAGTGTGTLL